MHPDLAPELARVVVFFFFFFLNNPAPTELTPLPQPAPLPIWGGGDDAAGPPDQRRAVHRRPPFHPADPAPRRVGQPRLPRGLRLVLSEVAQGDRDARGQIGRAHV